MKRKTAILLLALMMIFTFVSCNPEASYSSVSSDPLLGEVTPPSEDERKSMSDADIALAYAIGCYKTEIVEGSTFMNVKASSEKIGSITIQEEGDEKTTKITINGNIKIGTDEYKVENSVYTIKSDSSTRKVEHTVEKGRVLKNGAEITYDEAYYTLNAIEVYIEGHEDEFDTYEYNFKFSYNVKLLKKDVVVGSGIYSGLNSKTKTSTLNTQVLNVTTNGVKSQIKVHSEGEGIIIDYVALDGEFFDKESIRKLQALIS